MLRGQGGVCDGVSLRVVFLVLKGRKGVLRFGESRVEV